MIDVAPKTATLNANRARLAVNSSPSRFFNFNAAMVTILSPILVN